MGVHGMTESQRLILETAAAREKAELLLRGLQEARTRSERHLAELGQRDPYKRVTGRSSLENAISSTQRLVDMLGRASDNLSREEHEGTLELLDESFQPVATA